MQIDVNITKLKEPLYFILTFSNSWSEFFNALLEDASKYSKLEIEGVSNEKYNYKI